MGVGRNVNLLLEGPVLRHPRQQHKHFILGQHITLQQIMSMRKVTETVSANRLLDAVISKLLLKSDAALSRTLEVPPPSESGPENGRQRGSRRGHRVGEIHCSAGCGLRSQSLSALAFVTFAPARAAAPDVTAGTDIAKTRRALISSCHRT